MMVFAKFKFNWSDTNEPTPSHSPSISTLFQQYSPTIDYVEVPLETKQNIPSTFVTKK